MPTDIPDGDESNDQGRRRDEARWAEVRERAQEAVRRAGNQGRLRGSGSLLNNRTLIIFAGVSGSIVICLGLYLLISSQGSQSANTRGSAQLAAPVSPNPSGPSGGPSSTRPALTGPALSSQTNDLTRVLATVQNPEAQTERWPARLARIGLSLALAALLGAVFAFRPQRDAGRRTPEMAQTHILIALLAAGLMLVASGDLAIALSIIGAALLIRLRPPGFDSRETPVMLVNAVVGLACGAARWELAIILGAFAFAVLWVLEYSQHDEPSRSVDLSVETRSVKETNEGLREVFDKNHIAAEFVRVDTSDPTGRTGIVHYSISVRQGTSLDRVSEEIFSQDPDNVLSVNWQQRRWPAVAYR